MDKVATPAPETVSRERFALLLRMLQELSRDTDPVRSINRYAKAVRALDMHQALISISLRDMPPGHYKIMRFLHQDEVGHEGFADLFYAGDKAEVHTGGLIGTLIRTPEVQILADLQVPEDDALGPQLAPYHSLIGFPVYSSGEIRNWVCFLSTSANHFSQEAIEYRILQANLMGSLTDVKHAHLTLQAATDYIQQQVDEIAHIQRGLLPAELPDVPGLQLAATYATYDRAGGDFYDIFPVNELCDEGCAGDSRWAFIIADASGHGPSAAVVVAMLSALLHSYPNLPKNPSDLLRHVNKHLLKKPINHSFVTAFLGFFEPETKTIAYSCAGHPMPMVRRSCGNVQILPPMRGIPLGISHEVDYTDEEIRLDAGQCMLLYTDGVTEARPASSELFGEARLEEALGACHGSPQETLDIIEAHLLEYEAGARQEDDQTMLALQAY